MVEKIDLSSNLNQQEGKRTYHKGTKQIARQKARSTIKKYEKKTNRAESRASQARVNEKRKKKQLKAISNTLKGKQVITTEIHIDAEIKPFFDEHPIAFKPHPGPQTEFLRSVVKQLLYGGAAGGGKSYALLAEALRFIHFADCRVLILRRTLDELDELIWKSKEFYIKAFPEAHFNKTEKCWRFPSGAEILFSYLDKDDDVSRYQGKSYTLICFDELTHWPTAYAWNYLASRLRTDHPDIDCYMRATCNPGGVGGWWVRKMFIDPAPIGRAFYGTDIETGKILRYPDTHHRYPGEPVVTRRFIPAKLQDNPSLWNDGQYEAQLWTLPEVERKRLLEGDWEVIEGAAFAEFEKKIHVANKFDLFKNGIVPFGMMRLRSCDYGFASPSCVLWGALHADSTLYIYREFYSKGYDPEMLGRKIKELERNDPMIQESVIDESAFGKHAGSVSIAEQINRFNLKFLPSDRDRISGKNQIHQRLRLKPLYPNSKELKPTLIILDNCINLIREITSIPISKTNPEDVNTKASDHAYDALRYMCMMRKIDQPSPYHRLRESRVDFGYQPEDVNFGY
jgi:hypothetical protein